MFFEYFRNLAELWEQEINMLQSQLVTATPELQKAILDDIKRTQEKIKAVKASPSEIKSQVREKRRKQRE